MKGSEHLKRALELCLAVYRITDKFSKDDVLRSKFREISIDIFESLVYNGKRPTNSGGIFDYRILRDKINILSGYCFVAERQGWVRSENFRVLREAYKRLYEDFAESVAEPDHTRARVASAKTEGPGARPRPGKSISGKRLSRTDISANLSDRQEALVKFISGNGNGATMADLAGFLEVSKKTVERDMKQLVGAGFVQKEGQTRSAKFFSS